MNAIILTTIIIIIVVVVILMIFYLNGYWDIKSREIIKSNTYDKSIRSYGENSFLFSGKETREVHKITYQNNRIKYVTKVFYH